MGVSHIGVASRAATIESSHVDKDALDVLWHKYAGGLANREAKRLLMAKDIVTALYPHEDVKNVGAIVAAVYTHIATVGLDT